MRVWYRCITRGCGKGLVLLWWWEWSVLVWGICASPKTGKRALEAASTNVKQGGTTWLCPKPAICGCHAGIDGWLLSDPTPTPTFLQDKQGCTPLHLAARYRQSAAVTALLEAAAASEAAAAAAAGAVDADAAGAPSSSPHQQHPARALAKARNKAGQNALHCAALGGCDRSAAALRAEAPASVSARDRQGSTPADLARRRGHAKLSAEIAGGSVGSAAEPSAAASGQGAVAGAQQVQHTLILAPPQCLEHHTCPEPIVRGGADPPPENVNRLRVLTTPGQLPAGAECWAVHGG